MAALRIRSPGVLGPRGPRSSAQAVGSEAPLPRKPAASAQSDGWKVPAKLARRRPPPPTAVVGAVSGAVVVGDGDAGSVSAVCSDAPRVVEALSGMDAGAQTGIRPPISAFTQMSGGKVERSASMEGNRAGATVASPCRSAGGKKPVCSGVPGVSVRRSEVPVPVHCAGAPVACQHAAGKSPESLAVAPCQPAVLGEKACHTVALCQSCDCKLGKGLSAAQGHSVALCQSCELGKAACQSAAVCQSSVPGEGLSAVQGQSSLKLQPHPHIQTVDSLPTSHSEMPIHLQAIGGGKIQQKAVCRGQSHPHIQSMDSLPTSQSDVPIHFQATGGGKFQKKLPKPKAKKSSANPFAGGGSNKWAGQPISRTDANPGSAKRARSADTTLCPFPSLPSGNGKKVLSGALCPPPLLLARRPGPPHHPRLPRSPLLGVTRQ